MEPKRKNVLRLAMTVAFATVMVVSAMAGLGAFFASPAHTAPAQVPLSTDQLDNAYSYAGATCNAKTTCNPSAITVASGSDIVVFIGTMTANPTVAIHGVTLSSYEVVGNSSDGFEYVYVATNVTSVTTAVAYVNYSADASYAVEAIDVNGVDGIQNGGWCHGDGFSRGTTSPYICDGGSVTTQAREVGFTGVFSATEATESGTVFTDVNATETQELSFSTGPGIVNYMITDARVLENFGSNYYNEYSFTGSSYGFAAAGIEFYNASSAQAPPSGVDPVSQARMVDCADDTNCHTASMHVTSGSTILVFVGENGSYTAPSAVQIHGIGNLTEHGADHSSSHIVAEFVYDAVDVTSITAGRTYVNFSGGATYTIAMVDVSGIGAIQPSGGCKGTYSGTVPGTFYPTCVGKEATTGADDAVIAGATAYSSDCDTYSSITTAHQTQLNSTYMPINGLAQVYSEEDYVVIPNVGAIPYDQYSLSCDFSGTGGYAAYGVTFYNTTETEPRPVIGDTGIAWANNTNTLVPYYSMDTSNGDNVFVQICVGSGVTVTSFTDSSYFYSPPYDNITELVNDYNPSGTLGMYVYEVSNVTIGDFWYPDATLSGDTKAVMTAVDVRGVTGSAVVGSGNNSTSWKAPEANVTTTSAGDLVMLAACGNAQPVLSNGTGPNAAVLLSSATATKSGTYVTSGTGYLLLSADGLNKAELKSGSTTTFVTLAVALP